MKLILCRHAQQNNDAIQSLSEEGKRVLGKTIAFMKREGYMPEYIYASPSLRTTETAELIRATFRCPLELEEALRSFDALRLMEIVKSFPLESLLFVGHAPSITEFAQSLVSEPVPQIGRGCALVFHVDKTRRCLVSIPLVYITPDGVVQL